MRVYNVSIYAIPISYTGVYLDVFYIRVYNIQRKLKNTYSKIRFAGTLIIDFILI